MFSMLHSIKSWPKRPSEYGLCKLDEDLTWMVAHDQTEAKMQAYEQELAEEESKRKQNASKRVSRR